MATAAVYSHRFISQHDLTSEVSWPCPEGYVAVAVHADVVNGGELNVSQTFLRFVPPAGDAVVFGQWSGGTEGAAFYGYWDGRFVITAGESFDFTTTGTWDVSLSGYLLVA